ncbi:hypothetical protein RKD28_002942 [Streptomyces sp. SAI-229]
MGAPAGIPGHVSGDMARRVSRGVAGAGSVASRGALSVHGKPMAAVVCRRWGEARGPAWCDTAPRTRTEPHGTPGSRPSGPRGRSRPPGAGRTRSAWEVRVLVVGCAQVRVCLPPVVRSTESLPSAAPGCASSRPCGAWKPCCLSGPGCASSRRGPRSGCGYARRAGRGGPAVCRVRGVQGLVVGRVRGAGMPVVRGVEALPFVGSGARKPRGRPRSGCGHTRRAGRGSLIVHRARVRKPRPPAPRRQPPGAHCSFRRGCRILEVWSSSGTSRSSGRGGRKG